MTSGFSATMASIVLASVRSPSMTFAPALTFVRTPVEKLSTTVTRQPRARYASARCEPMNPAPPVTTTCRMSARRDAVRAQRFVVQQRQEVLAVRAVAQLFGEAAHAVRIDQPEVIRHLLGARDLQPLPQLHGLDEVRRLQQRFLRAGVEPRVAAAELLDAQLAALEVDAVQIGDLQLAARRRLQRRRELRRAMIVEVPPRHREVRARLLRLFFDADRARLIVELDDAVALGVEHAIREDGRSVARGGGAPKRLRESMTIKDVVAEDDAARRAGHELGSGDEGLRQSAGIRLFGVTDPNAPLAAVPEGTLKQRLGGGRGDQIGRASGRE